MPSKPAAAKRDSLRQQGTLHPHPESVADPLFQHSEFFDPEDLLQVKYEMVRRVQVDKQSVSDTAAAFGVSRPTLYQAQSDFVESGLFGLIPKKRGPRRAHKLTGEVLDFLRQAHSAEPHSGTRELAAAVQQRFGLTVHPRSIQRALARKEKKRR
jgi:transposase